MPEYLPHPRGLHLQFALAFRKKATYTGLGTGEQGMLPGSLPGRESAFMGTLIKHTLVCGTIGLVLAGFGWLAWWLGSIALGAELSDPFHTLGPALVLGLLAAGVAGAFTSFLHRRGARQSSPLQETAPQKKRQRRPPLDQHPYRARITPALRWQAISKSLSRLFHGSKKQLTGKPISSLLHPEDAVAVAKAFTHAQANKKMAHVLCRFLGPDQPTSERKSKKKSLRPAAKSWVHVRLDIWARRDRAGYRSPRC